MDDSAQQIRIQWQRLLEQWRQELQTPIEINVQQIVGGGQPLTRVNDTNVTGTLTGTPLTALLKPVTLTLGWTGTLAAARLNANVVQAVTNDTNVTGVVAAQVLTLGWTGTLGVARGGTNLASYAVGDLLYASGATTLSKLADVAAGSYLRSGGVTTAPAWSTLTLPNAATTGDLVYASATNTLIVRTIGSAAEVLTVSGGLPVWAAPAAAGTTTITDDTTTNATMYPTWVTAASGSLPLKVSSTKLTFNPSISRLHLTNTVAPEFRIDLGTGTTSFASVLFYEGASLGGGFQYIGSAFATAARRSDLALSGTRIVLAAVRTLVDADATLTATRSLTVGSAANTFTGIELRANSTSWFTDHRGTIDATNDRWMLGTDSASNILVALRTGQIGIGIGSPTAYLHLKAGTTAASTAPLKFASGTNQTTAEAGAMEYNGTNLFFTRAGTVRENVLVAIDNVAAPGTTAGVAIVNFYGSAATNYLGDPNRWLSVNVLGTTYKIPLYT